MQRAFVVMLLPVLFTLHVATSAPAQEGGRRTVTRTRLQVLFADLEEQWSQAVQQKDAAALRRLLDDAFQVWTAARPGDPTPREEWQARAFGRTLQSSQMRQLAVRAVAPTVSVASFTLSETFEQAGKSQTEDSFIVDVWVKSGDGDDWKCTDRYVSTVTGIGHPTGPKKAVKPTGKE